jgi:hypothetical protein
MKHPRGRALPFSRWLGAATFVLGTCAFVPSARADDFAQAEARRHFLQGVTLVDQQRLTDALAEFELCYSLYPAYATLYNIGQVHAALGHSVAAVEVFEKYLNDGGTEIPPKQRARVEAELASQRERIGEITIEITPGDAELRIDDKLIAHTGTIITQRLAIGHHRVDITRGGYRSEQRDAEIAPQAHVQLAVTLEPLPPVTTPVVLPRTPPRSSPVPDTDSRGATQRTASYVVGGLGLVGVGVGISIALGGQAKHRDALDEWYAGDHDAARKTEDSSMRQKTAGYVVIGMGGAATAIGAILFLTAPRSSAAVSAKRRAGWTYSPWFTTSSLGASLQTRW